MSDHATKAAEAVTHAMSRRGFLGRFAQVAGGLAAGMAGVLAMRAIESEEITRACPRSRG